MGDFEVVIREGKPSDHSWIMSSWLSSYLEHTDNRLVRKMPRHEYYRRWRRIALCLLTQSRVLIACPGFDLDTILGWCVVEPPDRLHYVHVRQEAQHNGVCRALLNACELGPTVLYSHRTTCSDELPTPDAWVYAPWLVIGA